jgi:hypothetical protein
MRAFILNFHCTRLSARLFYPVANMRSAIGLVLLPGLLLAEQAWVVKSNENARLLLDVMDRYSPESAGNLGVSGLDENITMPDVHNRERARHDTRAVLTIFKDRLGEEGDPQVKNFDCRRREKYPRHGRL